MRCDCRIVGLLLLTGLLCGVAFETGALEGGYTSDHRDWRDAPAPARPDAATREAELAARAEAMAADAKRLRARLERAPRPAVLRRLYARLREIHAAYGWVPELELVYGRRSLEPMLHCQDAVPPSLLAAFVQLKGDLAARGVDLIVVPLVPTPFFTAHLLDEGCDAESEIYPGWTRMMLEMLAADIEIIDTVDEFRAEAEDPVLVGWVNDFHTGSRGRQLAARALATRLRRYAFARELAGNRELWTAKEKERTGARLPQRILVVNRAFMSRVDYWREHRPELPRYKAKRTPLPEGLTVFKGKREMTPRPDLPAGAIDALRARRFRYLELARSDRVTPELCRTHLVMIGDSQLHSAVYGSGLPEFVMREVGGLFRWGSKSWHGFSPPEIYREVVPDDAAQPRVAVLTFLPKYFWNRYRGDEVVVSDTYKPRPLPPYRGAGDATAFPDGPFRARVRITAVSVQPDPETLDYDDALTHNAAIVLEGPGAGGEIGVRYWAMHERRALPAAGAVRPGQVLELTLRAWRPTIAEHGALAHHQVFDDVDQAISVPVFWVTGGPLAPERLLGDGR